MKKYDTISATKIENRTVLKANARKHVQYLRSGFEQFLTEEDKLVANDIPRHIPNHKTVMQTAMRR